MRLSGKTALVTGSDQGIGQGIALRLAEEGADVVVNYRKNRDGAETTRAQIEKLGRRSASIQPDAGPVADTRRLVAEASAPPGGLATSSHTASTDKHAA